MDHHYRRKEMGGMAKNGGMGGATWLKNVSRATLFSQAAKAVFQKIGGRHMPCALPTAQKVF